MAIFLTLALVQLIALVSPGPDFFFVTQTAVSRSRSEALAGVAGITLGVAVWAALALLGLQWLFQRMHWLQQGIRMAGGAYLIWLGWKLWRSARRVRISAAAAWPPSTPSAPGSVWRSLLTGLGTNLANPKVVVYFGSIFSAFAGNGRSWAVKSELWALVVLETLVWFGWVATLFALPAMRRGYLRLGRWIDGVAGTIFVAFGLHLLLGKRPI